MVSPSRQKSYIGLDGRRVVDLEKRGSFDSDDDSSSSSYSSRNVSDSQQVGLLSSRHQPHPRYRALPSLAYMRRRRCCSRIFTGVLATFLITFIVVLTHLSSLSNAQVKIGWKHLQPPPPWEAFVILDRYYGGVKSIVTRSTNKPEWPNAEKELDFVTPNSTQAAVTDAETSSIIQKRDLQRDTSPFNPFANASHPSHEPCFILEEHNITVPALQMHNGVPSGMPDHIMGSYDVLGLRNDGCFDRYGRLGPYGLGYSKAYGGTGAGLDGEGVEEAMSGVWGAQLDIDYTTVSWADAQDRCARKNEQRYAVSKDASTSGADSDATIEDGITIEHGKRESDNATLVTGDRLPRSAVIVRTWHGYEYDAEDLLYLRALINELALQSGGQYTVHFLIHVKDESLQIWSSDEVYQRTLKESLPAEFRGMGSLWSEKQMSLIYDGLQDSWYRHQSVHDVYRSTYMPVQYFAHNHPEYDFYWNWEMDVRYIGHYYHLLDRVSSWAQGQPRKGLWERNGRFYVPSEHGTWEEFSHMVRVQTEHGTAHRNNLYHAIKSDPKSPLDAQLKIETPVWGPLRPDSEADHFDTAADPIPPFLKAADDRNSSWGVGEPADLITFNPLFDPEHTSWILRDDVTGYNTSEKMPPRRAAITTTTRLSRRLLRTMHRETSLARHTMSSEMWPSSVALQHGLKAVYAPHPVYVDRAWPTDYLAAIFNNGRNGASGGAPTSVFSDERQHNFRGSTWYYDAQFPARLWRRWLGYKVDGQGGEVQEKGGEGRMCLPSMLLHPVKHVDMIYDQ